MRSCLGSPTPAASSVRKNDFALLDRLYRQWSPSWDYDDAEIRPTKDCFAHPEALDAALGYYRALRRWWGSRKLLGSRTEARALLFAGTGDVLPPSVFEASKECFTEGADLVVLDGPGHFLHREAPDVYADAVLRWLKTAA